MRFCAGLVSFDMCLSRSLQTVMSRRIVLTRRPIT